jgi:hypothetical protein
MGVGGVSAEVDRFLDQILSDLAHDDVKGRLKRLRYVIDRVNLDLPIDAARLELQMWQTSPLFRKAR